MNPPLEPPPEQPPGLLASVRAVSREPEPEREGQRWGFGAFLLVEAVFILSAVFITALASTSGTDLSSSVSFVLVGSMVPTVLAAATAVVITRVRGNGPLIDLRLGWDWADVKVGLKLGLLGILLTVVAATVWSRVVGTQNATSAIGELVDGTALPLSAAVVMFVYVCFLGPVCEELIYRGLLWGAIERQPRTAAHVAADHHRAAHRHRQADHPQAHRERRGARGQQLPPRSHAPVGRHGGDVLTDDVLFPAEAAT